MSLQKERSIISDEKEHTMKKKEFVEGKAPAVKKGLLIGGILLVAVLAVGSCFAVIPAGHTGVVSTFGQVSEVVMQEGLNTKLPWQRVNQIDNRVVKLEVETEAFSSDLQPISVSVAVNYRVATSVSYKVYKNIGKDYESILVMPTTQEILKSVLSEYTAEEAVDSRNEITTKIMSEMTDALTDDGITITAVNITDFDLSEEYLAAVEAKVTAQQNLEKATTEQQQQTMIQEQEAERQRIKADADLYAAQKQAEANEALASSLSDTLVEYYKIQQWDGKLPVVSGGTSIIGMDMEDLTDQSSDDAS
jgi:regulator of protease activity HflC (stomatin/prohibitin superfamily)